MAKLESTFRNMVIALLVVTLISAGALGIVNDLTKDAIEAAKLEAKNEAIRSVLPQFDELAGEFKIATNPGDDSLEIYPAYKDGKLIRTMAPEKRFYKAGILNDFILIGSWCIYFYKDYHHHQFVFVHYRSLL